MGATQWVTRFGYLVASKASRPGIYRLQTGGYLVRGRATDPRTGKRVAVIRALHDASVTEAQAALDSLLADKRDTLSGNKPQRQLLSEFAAQRFEAKIGSGNIKSAKGREKWESFLRVHFLPTFGTMRCDEIRPWHVETWRASIAKMITNGYESRRKLRGGKVLSRHVDLSPQTANTWIALAKTLFGEMTRLLELARDPSASLEPFDTSQHPTYTDESPNSLTPEQARTFLEKMHALFPQHYAMTLLGFVTGKRPSTLRPLRATGDESDVAWEEGFIRFRRSHTRRDEFMGGTKTGTRERVYLPEAVMVALRTHRGMVTEPPRGKSGKPPLWWRAKMARSPLLFPGRDGGPRSTSCLDKPFEVVSRAIELGFHVTPRAMRRTCNDLCRAAQVDDVVTRSITGHLTDKMRLHYSTAQASEQRTAIAKVIDLVSVRQAR